MKKRLFTLMSIAAALVSFSSCNKDNGPEYYITYPNALVTAKTSAEDVFYLQLDDKTTLRPVNVSKSPFGDKEVRALCYFDFVEGKPEHFDRDVKLHWIDSVRTKSTVMSFGDEDMDEEVYGDEAIEIYNNWITVLEDGYLSFCAYWGNPNIKHSIDLVAGVDENDPYLLDLRHNNLNDNIYVGAQRGNGIIAFKLNHLPDTKGETVKLKIRYNSLMGGQRIISFDYRTGQSSGTGSAPSLTGLTKGLSVE